MKRTILFLQLLLLFLFQGRAWCEESTVVTVWPLIDYRHDPDIDYTSVNLLGPLFTYDRKENEREYGLRPFYFHAEDPDQGIGYSEYLYPVAVYKSEPDQSFFDGLHLFTYDFGAREEGSDNEFTLFPFLFYGESETRGDYFALFPVGGKIYERFGRDEIRFALFPLYGRTRKAETQITNVLWPIFARIRGERESGLKFWPLYGSSDKEGVYRKRFYLWPIVFRYDLKLDTDNPMRRRMVFPLYVAEESPQLTSRTYLWPFFSHREDRRRDYEEWNFPWPLFRVARGEFKESRRFLPFYANERTGSFRKRWYLWPIYKIEELQTEVIERRRDRVLFFLYSNLEETVLEEGTPRKKRVDLWPLFFYRSSRGVSYFQTLALAEPFFPENQGIERNWSPLWSLYQRKWDKHGNEISSLFWNLYWKERRGDALSMELFPLFRYQRVAGERYDLQVLKGLLRYRSGPDGGKLNLLYLPWGFGWQAEEGHGEG